jgi:hypothetical protein
MIHRIEQLLYVDYYCALSHVRPRELASQIQRSLISLIVSLKYFVENRESKYNMALNVARCKIELLVTRE